MNQFLEKDVTGATSAELGASYYFQGHTQGY